MQIAKKISISKMYPYVALVCVVHYGITVAKLSQKIPDQPDLYLEPFYYCSGGQTTTLITPPGILRTTGILTGMYTCMVNFYTRPFYPRNIIT